MSRAVAFKTAPFPYGVSREHDDFGYRELDLIGAPSRFYTALTNPPSQVHIGVDSRLLSDLPRPSSGLSAPLENWQSISRRSQARLNAWFLVCEDPQRRLESREVQTLAHQASLVRFVLESPHLARVLVADEVGLGKTVEAGLIIKELLDQKPGLRVLYLSPARLVANVHREFQKMGLPFRRWVAGEERDGNLETDDKIIASIHRAAYEGNFEAVLSTKPWDIIVVDECHHLSAYGKNDGKKAVRQYSLVEKLLDKLNEGGRVLLMSGTPHQGNPTRFENLLQLLKEDDEGESSLAGRVIYRTKQDVRGWNKEPLFPLRQVNPPKTIATLPDYKAWLASIHTFYTESGSSGGSEAARRAGNWRCGQALQWAASSVQAGLGYLVRQAMRLGWSLESEVLKEALRAIRPYRRGSADEDVTLLFARIKKELGQSVTPDDVEEDEGNNWQPDQHELQKLIEAGIHLLKEVGDSKWEFIDEQILSKEPTSQFVLFAQPIETVTSLASFLERRYGMRPSLIIGGQSDEERDVEVQRFWSGETRFLISSRAGNEGINLQCAHRLVHVDVPWNPMDLEQRVGRVHRFGSRKPIVVDTVVLEGSREEHVYSVAYRKLFEIASTLTQDPERFQELFARVMSLVPPADLHEILADQAYGPLTVQDTHRLAGLVESGLKSWRSFHEKFHTDQQLAELDPGEVTWDDLVAFSVQHAKAKVVEGFTALKFRMQAEDAVVAIEDAIPVLELADGTYAACADIGGLPVQGPSGEKVVPAGLNLPTIAEALRSAAFPVEAAGPAYLRWQEQSSSRGTLAVLAMVRVAVRKTQAAGWQEHRAELRVWTIDEAGNSIPVASGKGNLVRELLRSSVRSKAIGSETLVAQLKTLEELMSRELRIPSPADREAGIRYAVIPLFAAIVAD